MLAKRFFTGIVLVIVLIGTVFYFPRPAVALVIALIVGGGLWEFYILCENKGFKPFKIFGICEGIALSVIVYLVESYNFPFEINEIINIALFFIIASILVKYAFKKDSSSVIINGSATLLGILYVSFLFTFIIKVRFLDETDIGIGRVMSLFVITKISDIFAYFFGMKWGRHKLIPRISANKSIEGTIAGVIGAALSCTVLKVIWLKEFGWAVCAGLGIIIGVVAQIGDLVESLIKRDARVKDSGRFVPGLGGVLDFMDSILFAGPVMYIIYLVL